MASQSVLELAVNTGKWDSGLKKAKSALDNFTTASGGLQQALGKDSDKMQKFVQMMGSMESKAKTAKGQMNDYKSTIEQLMMQYNRMTEAQQKTIGQDYLRVIDQLRQKYQAVNQEVQQMNRSLQQAPSTPVGGGFLSGMGGKVSGALQVFGGNLLTKGAGMLAGLASEMGDMVKQGVELARQGEGIRIAFERLGRGDILDGLRQATHGTVTDLELMKAAVKFNDFKLPLEELGTMLAFAQQKAKDTGQSVDYMVDSIVTGLGRKSLMILDNLGLSASEIKNRMAETGDMTKAVGDIIRDQMSKAGDYVETAADRAAQANVSLQNKMEELGRKFAPVEESSNQLWTSMKIGILDIVGGPLARLLNGLTEAGRLKNMLNDLNGGEDGKPTEVERQVNRVRTLIKAGGNERAVNTFASGIIEDYNRQIMALDAKIKDTKKLSPDQRASKFVRDEVQKMGEQMKALGIMRDQFAAAVKDLTKPVKPVIDTSKAEQSVTTLTKNLKDTHEQREIVKGSLNDLNNQIKELRDAQANVTNVTEWQNFQTQIDAVANRVKELKGELSNIESGNMVSLGKIKGVSIRDMVTVPTAADMIRRGDQRIKNFKTQDKPTKQEVKLTDVMSQIGSGISSMVSGIEGLGIELPKGMKDVLGGIQAVTSILSGISTIVAAIEAISAADTIIPFASGGVVKAAGGYRVPGRTFSGDMIPARLNAGETVLNQAQAGVIANALQDREFGGSGMMQPYVDGEKIFLGMNNTSKRMGRGEIVTTSTLRRLGLI